ncbi:MAG: zinc-binding alcohol dehydrogenase family protein [Candidatus Acidiferrales bacterium]
MNAAVLHAFGKPPRFEQFAEPFASEGEVVVHVLAAALHPSTRAVASGSHYASPKQLPAVCGLDGCGRLDNGKRVYFGGPRPPGGTMAERCAVPRARCWPVPDRLDDATAAAIVNPALSSWLPLVCSAHLAPGETVLILGATGTAGKLAIQIAKFLGAGRVVAAGRNEKVLSTLRELGADATVSLALPDQQLVRAFADAGGGNGYNVIVDYLWGRPTELLLAALTRAEFLVEPSNVRLLPIGESAGPAISLRADAFRSAGLAIPGGGFPAPNVFLDIYNQLMALAADGKLRIEAERVPLADVESAWQRTDLHGRRLVFIP